LKVVVEYHNEEEEEEEEEGRGEVVHVTIARCTTRATTPAARVSSSSSSWCIFVRVFPAFDFNEVLRVLGF
jgi:hypothetical protein